MDTNTNKIQWHKINSPFGALRIAFTSRDKVTVDIEDKAPLTINRIPVTGYFSYQRKKWYGGPARFGWSECYLRRSDKFLGDSITASQRAKLREWADAAIVEWADANRDEQNRIAEIANITCELGYLDRDLAELTEKIEAKRERLRALGAAH